MTRPQFSGRLRAERRRETTTFDGEVALMSTDSSQNWDICSADRTPAARCVVQRRQLASKSFWAVGLLLAGVGVFCLATTVIGAEPATQPSADRVIRVGIIGLDTSHAVAFTEILNAKNNTADLADVRVVAGFPGGSPDVPYSRDRVEGYTAKLRDMGVEIVPSIEELLGRVDAVLLESVDGRPHLEQVRPVIAARKPVFVDKPFAGSLRDCCVIARLAADAQVPIFSSSSLRFSSGFQAARRGESAAGAVRGCHAYSPCSLEPHHPDLFWYGIHGVEVLYTVMGPGCASVTRTNSAGADVVVGLWNDGRIGVFRGIRDGKASYGALVFGTKEVASAGNYEGYKPLVVEIAKFFKSGKPPVAMEETLELYAFMEAADESKRQGGKPVSVAEVLTKAQQEAQQLLGK